MSRITARSLTGPPHLRIRNEQSTTDTDACRRRADVSQVGDSVHNRGALVQGFAWMRWCPASPPVGSASRSIVRRITLIDISGSHIIDLNGIINRFSWAMRLAAPQVLCAVVKACASPPPPEAGRTPAMAPGAARSRSLLVKRALNLLAPRPP